MYKLTFFFLLVASGLFSQNIAAFSDYQKEFFVFDDGKFRNLEHQEVLSFQVGEKSIAYQANNNHLKVYYNHIDYDVAIMANGFKVTNNLISYMVGSQLYVFDKGTKKTLTKFVGNYKTCDSIIGFFDIEDHYLKIFYQGKILNVADGNLSEDSVDFILGSNMLAFTDISEEFKVFYQNNIYDILQTDETVNAKIGRDVMAYTDPSSDTFYAFFKGEIIELESFMPRSFQVGYEKVAYIDNMDAFKLFDNGIQYIVSDFAPESYFLKDDMLMYHMQNQLWAFYEGENVLVENYIPTEYKYNNKRVVYLDQNGYLNLFDNGNHKILSYEQINDFDVLRNVIVFNQGVNTTKIYYKDKMYTK